ncbi:STAS domain-containing protein [Lentisphaera profundi]|uniref:STAS domain-containing protein n=1 Tax=Lentisphaera profundi TaxID=1658616 RepID=A0ABY7VYP9_9BACT|nr:STAS domain-containing protein [Lentisphaera profundi]WDE97992.1 STAS domain-containing protein [Lentisphaera profundi]
MQSASITVCIEKDTAHLAVKGRGTFDNSEAIRSFCMMAIEGVAKKIDINMLECSGMDSTFMGILTMLSRMGSMKSCPVELSNVNEANKKNFTSLGISQILNFTNTSTQQMSMHTLHKPKMSEDEKHKNILDAHQELIDANDANRPVFQDIITYLKENQS